MNIPNLITISRFFLIPAFVYLMLSKQYNYAIAVFVFAGFTDILDGYIARKYNKVTDLGKILDPLADKLMQLAALFMIVIMNIIPNVLPLLIIVFAKELMMAVGSSVLWGKGVIVQAVWYGKASTVIFYAAVVLSIILRPLGQWFLLIAVISQVIAFLMYLKHYFEIRKEIK